MWSPAWLSDRLRLPPPSLAAVRAVSAASVAAPPRTACPGICSASARALPRNGQQTNAAGCVSVQYTHRQLPGICSALATFRPKPRLGSELSLWKQFRHCVHVCVSDSDWSWTHTHTCMHIYSHTDTHTQPHAQSLSVTHTHAQDRPCWARLTRAG